MKENYITSGMLLSYFSPLDICRDLDSTWPLIFVQGEPIKINKRFLIQINFIHCTSIFVIHLLMFFHQKKSKVYILYWISPKKANLWFCHQSSILSTHLKKEVLTIYLFFQFRKKTIRFTRKDNEGQKN